MKKVTALALALMLTLSMASVAFAADAYTAGIDSSGNVVTITNLDLEDESEDDGRLYPGEEYEIALSAMGLDADAEDVKSVTVSWSKGGALVSSLKLKEKGDADAYLLLTFNENYTITSAKDLYGKLTIKFNDGTDDQTLYLSATVGNELVEIDGYSKKSDAEDDAIDAQNNTLYECTDAGYIAFNSDTRLFTVTLKMATDEKAFMYNSEDMIDEIEDDYGDLDAEIYCYSFGGRPTFKNAAEFSLQADYADQYYVYEWNGSKLTVQDYDWNSIDGVYEWSTKSPKAYVISDVELVAADEDEDDTTSDTDSETADKTDENPDTGAHDVVGVAAALAVVSLVAAGAVSLKK